MWCLNHRTLLPAEVPILESLGFEVFVPKRVPDDDPDYRSAAVTFAHDAGLSLPPLALSIMNRHNFYRRPWSSTLAAIINREFDAVICGFNIYTTCLMEAATKFGGLVIARTFGREHPRRYAEFAQYGPHPRILDELAALKARFVHAQGYGNLAEIEPEVLQASAAVAAIPLPDAIYRSAATWNGSGSHAILVCPSIGAEGSGGYYRMIYDGIKRDFGNLPHLIFGRQIHPVDDPAVLGYMTDDELLALYAAAPVFIYPSVEPRHVHYSPIEAMVVGTPVLYLRGGLIDSLAAGAPLGGACASVAELRAKAARLIAGDRVLARSIVAGQERIVSCFSKDLARRQWEGILGQGRGSSWSVSRGGA